MVDIVIVNWNSGKYLFKCVQSILAPNSGLFVRNIFILDNNSVDSSLSLLPENSKIKKIKNQENLGFAKACNQGFKLCKATYTLLLNPDAQLMDQTLEECIRFMEENNHVDILGCSLIDNGGKLTHSCARFPTPTRFFYDATGLSKIAPSIFTPALLMTDWDHRSNSKVDQVMGAFMFMPTTIFEKIGYFDERFFVYYEELDFSKRLALAGGTIFYNAFIKAIHSGGGTTENVKGFRLFLSLKSRLEYSKKHFGLMGYFLVWLCTFCIEPVTRNIFLLLNGKFSEMKEVIKGYRLLLANKKPQGAMH